MRETSFSMILGCDTLSIFFSLNPDLITCDYAAKEGAVHVLKQQVYLGRQPSWNILGNHFE